LVLRNILCGVILGSGYVVAASAHADTIDIGVGNTYYSPAFVAVEHGDTIHWSQDNGTHDVSSGVPCSDDSGLFYAPITSTNPTFDWIVPVTATAVIPYYCSVGGHCVNGDQYGALLIGTGAVHMIETNGYAFDPPSVTVQPGDVIVWENSGGTHDVTFGSNCSASGAFSEPLTPLFPLVTYVVPEDQPAGVIDYFCTPHCGWGMVGSITVEASGNDCPADVNGSGSVTVDDLLAVIGAYNSSCSCPEDVTGDGFVNVEDVLAVLADYGQDC
jgi:plastocyanin